MGRKVGVYEYVVTVSGTRPFGNASQGYKQAGGFYGSAVSAKRGVHQATEMDLVHHVYDTRLVIYSMFS